MPDFYLTLPSNTPGTDNTTSSYRVNLPSFIDLHGEWEVGLSEIFYPNSWCNINEDDCYFMIVCSGKQTQTYTFYKKRYENVEDLIDNLNHARNEDLAQLINFEAEKDGFELKFYFKKSRYRVYVEGKGVGYRCVLSKKLQYMLGFETDVVMTGEHQHSYMYAKHAPDLAGGFTSLFVYCDLIAPQVVGDVNAQVLRVVNIEKARFGESVEKQYINPHYVPILKKEFSSIEINIKDDTGSLVPFEYGKVCVKLHFRKRRL